MTIFSFYNQKGGVGKTASSVNLAYLAAVEGYRTLLWDLDPQGAAGFYFNVNPQQANEAKKILKSDSGLSAHIQPSGFENLDIIPSDMSARNADVLISEAKQGKKKIKSLLQLIKKEYAIVIIDCPPGLSVLHDSIFAASDWIIVPNIPTTLSMRSFDTVASYFADHKLDETKIRSFFSMVDHRKNLHHELMNEHYKDKRFFKNYIPYLSDVEKMGINLAPVESFAYSSFAAQCYRDLWKEMSKACIA
jgi:chromosome partitioning protein